MIRFTLASRSTAVVALVVSMLIPTSHAFAQEPAAVLPSLRQSAIRHARAAAAAASSPSPREQQFQVTTAKRKRSTTRKVVGGALGAMGGLFLGGYVGAVIEGDSCSCDDPGLMGALIGAPIGMALGGILGFKLF